MSEFTSHNGDKPKMGIASLRTIAEVDATRRWLEQGGLSVSAAGEKAEMFARAAAALIETGVAADCEAHGFFVPGRIEVFGKHTDYAGGRSLLAAAEKGLCFVAAARNDRIVRAAALDLDDQCEFAMSADLTPASGHWSDYLVTVARRVASNFPGQLCGADIAFTGDLPKSAGMSSSAALVVGCFLSLAAVNNLADRDEFRLNITSPESLAEYLGAVENGMSFGSLTGDIGVGTFGGSEDHTAILCCRRGEISQYSFCPVRAERTIKMPQGYTFAIAVCGVEAAKTGDAKEKYNRLSLLAVAVAEAWNSATGRNDPHIAAALASGELDETAEKMRDILQSAPSDGPFSSQDLLNRFEQFIMESEDRIPFAGDALERGDMDEFGKLAENSHRWAERLLGNQIPQTSYLARQARKLGAASASAFGAGFGGSVWAIVRDDRAEELLAVWARDYRQAFPANADDATFLLTRPGPAVIDISLSVLKAK